MNEATPTFNPPHHRATAARQPTRGERRANDPARRPGWVREDDTATTVGGAKSVRLPGTQQRADRRISRNSVSGSAHTLEASSPGLSADVEQVLTSTLKPSAPTTGTRSTHFGRRLADTALETVIIDDYHLIAESSAGEAFVHKLFSRTDARLLIASRVRPSWASARTGMYGELLEVGSAELALTPDETADILADSSVRVSDDLLAQADGWPAVIGLAALAQCPHERSHQALSHTLSILCGGTLHRSTRQPPGTTRGDVRPSDAFTWS